MKSLLHGGSQGSLGLLADDDPYEPVAENEVDFQPLHNPSFNLAPALQAGYRPEDGDDLRAAAATAGKLEIRPEHQHKTVSARGTPALTFVSPPEEELTVHSAAIQVRRWLCTLSSLFMYSVQVNKQIKAMCASTSKPLTT